MFKYHPMQFSQSLLAWYGRNARPLPWRTSREPYKIWVSEMILQQTQIKQGLAYYERFIERFPDVFSLASADEEAVLRLWQGLGYYSRARYMREAARTIVNQHEGRFPESYHALLKIKGIGPYTAAAIASIVFGEAVPVLDGNALRVYARYLGIYQPVSSTAGRHAIRDAAQQLIPMHHPGDYNQAVMDLGATVCMPLHALCTACPVAGDCYAYQNGKAAALPVKIKKPAVTDLFIGFIVIRRLDGKGRGVCLRRRTDAGIWKGLYDFPSLIYKETKTAEEILSDPRLLDELAMKPALKYIGRKGPVIHLLTHLRLHLYFFEFESSGSLGEFLGLPVKFYSPRQVSALPLPNPIEQYVRNELRFQ